MNADRVNQWAADWLVCLALAAWLILPLRAVGATEDKFEVLQTKTAAYTNVTVTTKAKDYVFIVHASGMASVKVAELPPEIQQALGYGAAAGSKTWTNRAAVWAKHEIAKIDLPQMEEMGQLLQQEARERFPVALSPQALMASGLCWAVLGGMLLLYLFYCYCCMLICRKTGNRPGIMVWLPVLQAFPLLRAAGMSGWWFLAYFVPVLNLVPMILRRLRIAQARGKSLWVGILLLVPVTNLFAFLYLAFADGGAAKDDDDRESRIMSLQTV